MLFALDICVKKKGPPTHSVHWGLNPPLHLKNIAASFVKSPLKSANHPIPPFQAIHPPTPSKTFFHATPPKKQKKSDFSVNSHNVKIFHH